MHRRIVAAALSSALLLPALALGQGGPAHAEDVPAVPAAAPVLDSLTPAANGWRPRFVTAVFHDAGLAPLECRFDTEPWAPCADGTVTNATAFAAGAHAVSARVVDATLVTPNPETSVPFSVETTQPTVRPAKAAVFTKASTVVARWSGTDKQSGIGSYQVRTAVYGAATSTAPWTYPPALATVTKASASIKVARGRTLCWSVRALDRVGNRGPWSGRTCTASMFDERGVAHSKGWKKKHSSKAFLSTYLETRRDRASFTLPRTRASQVAVVVTTCPTCGYIDYTVNGQLIDVIDLYTPKTHRGVVKTFRTKSKGRLVTVRIKAGTFGLVPVKIEGFGLSRY